MIFLKVKDIKHSLQCCFEEDCGCQDCVMYNTPDDPEDCQTRLIKITLEKLDELVNLLDDKVNHHYYDTLEELQEQNSLLQEKLDKIKEILS